MNIFSYVVDHDEGKEPNPHFGSCTLCRCKYSESLEETHGVKGRKNIVELAEIGDWVIGTGGTGSRSAGKGKLIYTMRVDEKPTRGKFYEDPRFLRKNPKRPENNFQREGQFALVSRHFWYFGSEAIEIPSKFRLEKNPRGFHYINPAEFRPFLKWLEANYRAGKQGEPCYRENTKGIKPCKSCC